MSIAEARAIQRNNRQALVQWANTHITIWSPSAHASEITRRT